MTRRLLVNCAIVASVLLLGATYAAVRGGPPALDANGPTRLQGTRQGDVEMVASHQVRRVRYRDRALLDYTFRLTNPEALPVTVTGIDRGARGSKVLRFVALGGPGGQGRFRVPAYGSSDVHLLIRITGCRWARGRGGVAGTLLLHTERLGLPAGTVRVTLPEELHTGQPRGGCPVA